MKKGEIVIILYIATRDYRRPMLSNANLLKFTWYNTVYIMGNKEKGGSAFKINSILRKRNILE